MSDVRVWFVTPGMDMDNDHVYREFPPFLTMAEVAELLHEDWASSDESGDEDGRNFQEWVVVHKHELLCATMTLRELRERVSCGKKLKIYLMPRDEANIAVAAHQRQANGKGKASQGTTNNNNDNNDNNNAKDGVQRPRRPSPY